LGNISDLILYQYIISFLPLAADLEGGRISDFSNSDTAYAQRDALVSRFVDNSTASHNCFVKYTIAAYAVGVLPYPNDTIEFLEGMTTTIMNSQPDGNFGAYPGYVE
jgi:hypothetical protein